MILYETLDGASQNVAERVATLLTGLFELLGEGCCHAAYHVNIAQRGVVVQEVVGDERIEILHDELLYERIGHVFLCKFDKRCQVAVG